MSDLGERVREGEDKKEEAVQERDNIIITLQEKVLHTRTHTHTLQIFSSLYFQISSLERELQIQTQALEVSREYTYIRIHAITTYM